MPQYWSHFLKQDCLKSPQGTASPSTLSPTSVPTRPMGRFSFGSQGSPQASSPGHSPVSRRRVQQQQQQQPIMGAGVSAGAFKICTCCVMHLVVLLLLLRYTDHKKCCLRLPPTWKKYTKREHFDFYSWFCTYSFYFALPLFFAWKSILFSVLFSLLSFSSTTWINSLMCRLLIPTTITWAG